MLKTTLDVAQKRHVHVQKTPFSTKNKKIGGGNFKKIGSKGFSGGASGCVPVGVGAELARLSIYARNRFELWRILPPMNLVP